MSNTVGLLIKTFAFMILFTLFISVFSLGASYLQATNFKTYVENQIHREGGLTAQAQTNVQSYSDQRYNGRFTVQSNSGNDKKPYGERVDYVIEGKLGFSGINLPVVTITVGGSSISMVR